MLGPPLNKVQSKGREGLCPQQKWKWKWKWKWFNSLCPHWFSCNWYFTRDNAIHPCQVNRARQNVLVQIVTCMQITSKFKVHPLFQTKDAYILQRAILICFSVRLRSNCINLFCWVLRLLYIQVLVIAVVRVNRRLRFFFSFLSKVKCLSNQAPLIMNVRAQNAVPTFRTLPEIAGKDHLLPKPKHGSSFSRWGA